ncbi:MAG: YceI family protein [Calditrichaceae bacterium]|nr:YceI family protein [Calditrichia bacterium]NUQ41675.1 YceI family protein [Calditrichaceae bacterium]
MQKYLVPVLFLVAVLLLNAGFSQPVKYNVDKSHSNVGFAVDHMVITTVYGKFNEYEIDLTLDLANAANSSVTARIHVPSIDTNEPKRDNHLRSGDFFDAENHPEVLFVSKKVEKTDTGYIAHGDLTIRGVTKQIALPFIVKGPVTDSWGNNRVGVEAKLTINRQEFGVKWNKVLDTGGLVAGNDVDIEIQAQFIAAK